MRNALSLVLIVSICILGAAERIQDRYASQVASIGAEPDLSSHANPGPTLPRVQPEPLIAQSATHGTGSADTAGDSLPVKPLARNHSPQMPSIQWSEAESFLQRIEQDARDLEARDVDRFNALIREAGRITDGLPPEMRPQFRKRLFAVIDKASELPPLPDDKVFEFEKE